MFVFASLTACAPPAAGPGRDDPAIIGGSADSGDPAVVLLISYPQDQSTFYTCTASFVSPQLLVTAAHCVDSANHGGYTFGLFLGESALAYSTAAELAPELIAVSEVHANPNYNPLSPFLADIGVVLVGAPQAITPLPFQKTPLSAAIVGQPARLVGYGQTVYQTFNDAKFSAATTVLALDSGDTVSVGDANHHSCVGDSGGPALVMMNGVETIIGVDSYTDVAGCTTAAHYRRLDEYVDFVTQYLPSPNDLGGAPDDLDGAGHDLDGAGHDLGGNDLASADLASAARDGSTTHDAATPTDPNDAATGSHSPAGGCSFVGETRPSSSCLLLLLLLALATLRRVAVRA